MTERALPGFKERLWLFGNVKWEGGMSLIMVTSVKFVQ